MLSSRLLVFVGLLFGFVLCSYSQEQQYHLVWGSSPTCGSKNLSRDSDLVKCSRTVTADADTYHLTHGKLSISIRYWWYASYIRIWTEVENGSDASIPLSIADWAVAGFESFDAFNAKEKALFLSAPENPDDGISRAGPVRLGVPSAGPGTSGLPDGGADPSRSVAPIPVVAENKRPSVMKWKEVKPRSKQSGEVRFDADSKARYLRITFYLNGTNYIYPLEKPKR